MSNKIIKDGDSQAAGVKKERKKPSEKRLQQSASVGGGSFNWSARTVVLLIGAIAVLAACFYVGFDQLRTKNVMTITGTDGAAENYTVSDMGYYIYEQESDANNIINFYKAYNADYTAETYWASESSEDSQDSNSQAASDNAIEEATKDFILYQKAKSAGYSFTDEDKSAAETEVKTVLESLSTKGKLRKGFSESELKNAIMIKKLIERFKTDTIASFKLDYDDITKDIKKKDYKQYDFEYYYISTEGETDEKGNTTELTEEQLAQKKSLIDSFYTSSVKDAKDFSTIFGNDENGEAKTSNDDGINYVAADKMLAKDGFKGLDKKIAKMTVGQVSEVLKGEDGYYIIKLTDNTSTESYDEAVKDAKETAESSAFEDEYTNNIEPNYTVDVDYDYWDAEVQIGGYAVKYE